MKLIKNIKIGSLVLFAKIFKKNIPLFVSWSLTNRCNMRCRYCNIPNTKAKELTTQQIVRTIDNFAKLGTQVIALTGGEPLLRPDTDKIIDYCKKKGIYVKVNSNGKLVKRMIKKIKNADVLQLSLDGPKKIHDLQRGKGSFENVIEAVNIAKESGMKVYFNTTITKFNVKHLEYIYEKSRELKVPVSFQPVTDIFFGAKSINRIYPEKEEFRRAIKRLADEKKSNPYILNSYTSLAYLLGWPHGAKIDCFAGRINYRIASDGTILPCNRTMDKVSRYNCLNSDFDSVFDRRLNAICPGCWCITALELNYAFSFYLEPILNIIRLDFLK